MTSTSLQPGVYNAESALLDLADTFLEPGSYSTLKSGFLGYLTASMARVAAEGAYHRNVLYRENFLNTASLPASIYNYAKIYDYPVSLATASSCRAIVGFYLDELRAAFGSETGSITLPRGQQVLLGSTPFVLEGAMRITVFDGGRVGAELVDGEIDFPRPNGEMYVRTYVSPQVVDAAGTTRTVVYAEVYLRQAVARMTEFQVLSSSALETVFYKAVLTTDEQLAAFRVLYKPAGATAFTELPAYFNETVTPTETEYCFYSFSDSGVIEVYFSALPGSFRPAYNSILRIEFLTTQGVAGNFTFTGIPTASISGMSLTPLVELVTQPAGGHNAETLKEVKLGILRKILERNNIIIEKDLENYLQSAVDRTQVNNSRLTFIKRRDDLQTRLFAAFLMINDSADRIVPTNTASLDLEVSDLSARGWSLRPGTLVVYDRLASSYRLIVPGEYPDEMATDPNSFVYCIPFLMEFRTAPFPRLVYYRNHADIDAALSALPGEVLVADSFLANSITVRRASAFEDTYQIDLALSSSLSNDALRAKCLLRIRFIAEDGTQLGYTEAVHVDGTNVFRAQVRTGDEFDVASRMLFIDSIRSDADDSLIATAPLPERIFMKAELYYDSLNPSTSVKHVVRGGHIYQLVHSFQTTEVVSLYQSLERVMYGNMYVTQAGTFHCDGVPLIGASFFLNPRIGSEVLGVIERYHSAILDAFDLLHNNTSVDVKLYDTYGPSRLFNIDRPNISIALEVRPRGRASEELRQSIIALTADFVRVCNDEIPPRFSISNLTTHLETELPDIAFVRFIALNGVAAQNVEQMATQSSIDRDNRRVPEFLNVTTILRSGIDQDPYVPDVQVTFI